MPDNKIKNFLDTQNVTYSLIHHSPAYTAPEIAAICHLSGKHLAKVVIVKADGELTMVVEPAHQRVDLKKLADQMGAQNVELASEIEFSNKFPGCEVGAMPPFGNLYNMNVYVSELLTHDDQIAFNAGSHEELIKMSYKDYEQIVRPNVFKH